MVDRQTAYIGAVPSAKDILAPGQFGMVGLAKLSAAVLGTSTVVNGFTLTPTGPATMSVILTPGEIYQLANLEATSWSALPADTTHSIVKQGVLLDAATMTVSAPGTVGFSQNYLLQVQYADSDTLLQVLNYYNTANPNVPFYGPPVGGVGSGAAQSTQRKGTVVYQMKAGTAATTGTQTTPSPDAGFVGLFVVTTSYGMSSVSAGNITTLSTAPFIPVTLPALPGWVQANAWAWCGTDTGSANAIVTTGPATPAITAYTAGLRLNIKKSAAANTGAVTINVNGVGAVSLTDATGSALAAGVLQANCLIEAVYDGSKFCIVGTGSTIANTAALTLSSGDAITVNVPSSTVTITIASPGVVTWTAHGLANNVGVTFSTTGALPTGLTAGVTYYTLNVTTNTFQVAATVGGAAINTSGSQSGTQSAQAVGAAVANWRAFSSTHNTSIGVNDGWARAKAADGTTQYVLTSELLTYLNANLSFVTSLPATGPGLSVGQFVTLSLQVYGWDGVDPQTNANVTVGTYYSAANLNNGVLPGSNSYAMALMKPGGTGGHGTLINGGTLTGTWQLVMITRDWAQPIGFGNWSWFNLYFVRTA